MCVGGSFTCFLCMREQCLHEQSAGGHNSDVSLVSSYDDSVSSILLLKILSV